MSYIDREETIKALDRLCDRVCQYSKAQRYVMCGACPLGDAFTVIEDDMHDADVEPIKRGKWIPESPRVAFAEECSNCGGIVYWDDGYLHRYPFCPNCGAKMDKGET